MYPEVSSYTRADSPSPKGRRGPGTTGKTGLFGHSSGKGVTFQLFQQGGRAQKYTLITTPIMLGKKKFKRDNLAVRDRLQPSGKGSGEVTFSSSSNLKGKSGAKGLGVSESHDPVERARLKREGEILIRRNHQKQRRAPCVLVIKV